MLEGIKSLRGFLKASLVCESTKSVAKAAEYPVDLKIQILETSLRRLKYYFHSVCNSSKIWIIVQESCKYLNQLASVFEFLDIFLSAVVWAELVNQLSENRISSN